MASLVAELRKLQMVLFNSIVSRNENPDEGWMLAQTSRDIPKNETVVVVDSDLSYGNARALALDLAKELNHDQLIFIAQDAEGLEWAKRWNLNAHIFSTKMESSLPKLWDQLIRAKVSVFDSHDWWRNRNQLILRSLLAGSFKIQLWHGATGPVGKVFGLERINSAPSWWHFVAVSTSSGMYDVLVNEPSQAEYRLNRSMLANNSVLDVEYRLVEFLETNRTPLPFKKLLIAPTYSESVEGEDALVAWVRNTAKIARHNGWRLDVAVHPGSKSRVARKIRHLDGVDSVIHGVSTAQLFTYSAVVTDFSGIAHDALLCNIPTVSVLVDFENYRAMCPSVVDDDQMSVAYVVNTPEELEPLLKEAMSRDRLAAARSNYVHTILNGINNQPGFNTRSAVLSALKS